jgi:hypothetical protein
MRSMRLRAETDAALVKQAKREGLSINEAVEEAVRVWLRSSQRGERAVPKPKAVAPTPRSQVTPRFKKGK